jgi:hypothetical protein
MDMMIARHEIQDSRGKCGRPATRESDCSDQSSSECLTRSLGHDKRIYFMNAGEV